MNHYILIEVRESRSGFDTNPDPDRIRKAIHQVIQDWNLDAADIVLRGDRDFTYYGDDIGEDRNTLQEIFRRHMSSAKSVWEKNE